MPEVERGKKVYELKVSLRGSQSLIWRRVQVLNDITLFRFHNILQLVMGWTNSHLHQFLVGQTYYGEPDPEYGADHEDDRRVRLSRVLRKPQDAMVYEYDFGDGWEHDIVLERIGDPDRGPNIRSSWQLKEPVRLRMLVASEVTTSSCVPWLARGILSIAT